MVRLSAFTVAALMPFSASAFSVSNDASVSRREAFAKTATTLIGGTVASSLIGVPSPARAEVADETPKVTSRMGGLLVSHSLYPMTSLLCSARWKANWCTTSQERYQDPRGWQILAPSGWNKFDGEVGAYDIKWQDLVDPTDNIKVSSSPVKSTTNSM
jgi:hypothetical protein